MRSNTSPRDDERLSGAAGASADSNAVFSDPQMPLRLEQVAPTIHEAASRFWQPALAPQTLSLRMKGLVPIALHAAVTSPNAKQRVRIQGAEALFGTRPNDG